MEWTDDAIVLAARPHGETSAILSLLTRSHGRHAGLARGVLGKRRSGAAEPGNRVRATWRARLEEQLGTLSVEVERAHAAAYLDDADRLAGLSAALAMAETALPEREPHDDVYADLLAFITHLGDVDWPIAYVRWELGLLADLGFGLDLGACAVTGRNDQLAYVSPKSGRAVSLSAGLAWKDKLLVLPGFLIGEPGGSLADGLRLTGAFLERYVFAPHRKALPPARTRLVDRLAS
ncbi:MAG: DNA repair protein RecO [Rhodospirillales bacterium]|nr:DNA repair protein RecO [Rhodospirillales bacterium]